MALLCSVTGIAGCSDATTPTNSNNPVNVTNSNSTSNSTTRDESTKSATTAKRDKIGVAECDEYLDKYDSCLPKLPEVERNAVIKSLEMYRNAWKDTATTPKGKSELALACKDMLEMTKEGTRRYGCTW